MFSIEGAVPPGLGPLATETESEYVLGFPMHVAVTVRGDSQTAYRALPYGDHFQSAGAFGLVLTRGNQTVVSIMPSRVVDRTLGIPTFVLHPGEAHRVLVDLSEFLKETPAPGEYLARLLYGAPPLEAQSPPFWIRLRLPGPQEQAELETLRPEVSQAGSWGLWTLARPPAPAMAPAPVSRADPARFNRVLRALFWGPGVDESVLSALDGFYAPEAEALKAELLQLEGAAARLPSQINLVRSRYPGLTWWADEVAAGKSKIVFERSQR